MRPFMGSIQSFSSKSTVCEPIFFKSIQLLNIMAVFALAYQKFIHIQITFLWNFTQKNLKMSKTDDLKTPWMRQNQLKFL